MAGTWRIRVLLTYLQQPQETRKDRSIQHHQNSHFIRWATAAPAEAPNPPAAAPAAVPSPGTTVPTKPPPVAPIVSESLTSLTVSLAAVRADPSPLCRSL